MKKIRITETQLKKITEQIAKESQLSEDILNPIKRPFRKAKDVFYGVKGAVTGQGYSYMKDVSELKTLIQQLKEHDKQNDALINRILQLNNNIYKSKMRPDSKKDLVDNVNGILTNYRNYKQFSDAIYNQLSSTLK
jgi:hypothetical protein